MKEVEAEVVETSITQRDTSVLVAYEKAQIDQQIATAKAYPRSIQKFKNEVLTWATADQETAESMHYLLPARGENGKPIEGPSVRFAEIALLAWGNTHAGATVVEEGDEFLTARGVCWDLERNTKMTLDVRRSISGKRGRFGANMIQVTGQAACAIARRNAIMAVIPMAFLKPALEAAKKVASGDEKTLAARRDAAIAYFKDQGVSPERLFGFLGIAGKEDVTLEHLQQMTAIRVTLKDKQATIEDYFGDQAVKTAAPENLDAFVSPVSVTASDDPGRTNSTNAKVPVTNTSRSPEDEELAKLFGVKQ